MHPSPRLTSAPLWHVHACSRNRAPPSLNHASLVRPCFAPTVAAPYSAPTMPQANRFVVHILAAVAEQEAEAISNYCT